MKKSLLIGTAIFCCMTAMAQWTNDPAVNTKVSPENQSVYGEEFAVNKDGLVYYNYNGPTGGTTATFLQILDKNGNKTIKEPGLVISTERARTWVAVNQMLMADNDGNAIISVSDCRYAPAESTNLSYTIYKVSPTGEMLWGEDGIGLEKGETSYSEAKISMIQLEDGSYIFAWARSSANGSPYKIYMERLSASGEFIWDNPVVLSGENTSYTYPWLVNAGDNQFILVCSKGTNQDLIAQKYDFDGDPVWPEDVTVYRGGFGTIPIWTFVTVIPDEKGGAFIGWYDDRYYTNFSKSYVSHITSDGEFGFISGIEGTALSNPEYLMGLGPQMVYDSKNDCLFTVHRECDANQNWHKLVLQKVSMDGELLWGSEGKDLTELKNNSTVSYYSIQTTGDGDFVVFYMYLDGIAANSNVLTYAVRIDGESDDATRVWGEDPILLSSAESNKASLESSSLVNNGYYVTMWSDKRLANTEEPSKESTYMQCINLDGTLLGTPSSIDNLNMNQDFYLMASTMKGNVTFNINSKKDGLANLSIYSISGQKVATPFNGQLESGTKDIIWNTANLNIGVYIATLTTSEGNKSIRIIVK